MKKKLFADVNNWHIGDDGVEFAKLKGKFEIGIVEATENESFYRLH